MKDDGAMAMTLALLIWIAYNIQFAVGHELMEMTYGR